MRYCCQLLMASLGGFLHAQTYVVDAANGPGAHFVDLPPAVAAVPDGATLDVRPGTYSSFTVVGKGLKILGRAGAVVSMPFPATVQVTGTAPGQTVVLSGLTMNEGDTIPTPTLSLASCQGLVVLSDILLAGSVTYSSQSLQVTACGRVHLRGWSGALISCSNSALVLENCVVSGWYQPTTSAIYAYASDVQVVSSTVRGSGGGFGLTYGVPRPGINQVGGTVTLLDTRVEAGINPYYLNYFQVPAVDGSGSLRISANSQLVPSNAPPTMGVTVSYPPLACVNSASGAPGSSLAGCVRAADGDTAILLLGWPGLPQALPGTSGLFWLDPAGHYFARVGVLAGGQLLATAITIPPMSDLRGLAVVWQAATFGPQNGFVVANPSVAVVR
ncbi:MAG: hypothetical protein FJ265_06215 [Planctomycetes bacterium]|nr:hypothetical protein [Planctomycetota bacterium]